MRQALVFPSEDGFWLRNVRVFQVVCRRAREQAINNIREAIEGYICVLKDELPVPKNV